MKNRNEKILDFLFEVNNFKLIDRKSYVTESGRRETDAEHAWHMSIFAICLLKELSSDVNLGRTLELIAIHDLVEIYAGDVFAYDDVGHQTKEENESKAAVKLFGILPSDLQQYFMDCWKEFEAGVTMEARYAQAMDKLQGFTQQIIAEGRTWKEEGISKTQTLKRTKVPSSFDPALAKIVEVLYQMGTEKKLWLKD
jgi:putative hydrolase of HD superfamily